MSDGTRACFGNSRGWAREITGNWPCGRRYRAGQANKQAASTRPLMAYECTAQNATKSVLVSVVLSAMRECPSRQPCCRASGRTGNFTRVARFQASRRTLMFSQCHPRNLGGISTVARPDTMVHSPSRRGQARCHSLKPPPVGGLLTRSRRGQQQRESDIMKSTGKVVCYALVTGFGLASMLQTAYAACGGGTHGTWEFYASQHDKNGGGSAIECEIGFSSGGQFTGDCSAYSAGRGNPQTTTITGNMMLSGSCALSGSIAIPGDKPVNIRAGHVNGNIGSGIATQGTEVLLFTLVKR